MKKKLLALITALALIVSLVIVPATAADSPFPDIAGHWGESSIEKWVGHGLVNGYPGGGFGPDQPITRGEFAMVLSRLMNYQTKGENTYADLNADAWYAGPILEATRAGVIRGDGASVRPEDKITREEVMVVVARVLNLTDGAGSTAGYADETQISPWALAAVKSMVGKGYIHGDNGVIRPRDNITRAEVLKILDNVFIKLYDKAGTYTEPVAGNVIVNTPDAVLKDMSITGDLIVAQGVAEGNLTLSNVKLAGNLIIRGGGVNSIRILAGSTVGGSISIERIDGKVRVITDGTVETVSIADGSDDVILEGKFDTVTLAAADATVTLKGSVSTLSIAVSARGASLEVPSGSTVSKVETLADRVTVSGQGRVAQVDVTAGEGVSVQVPGTRVTVSENAGAVKAGQTELQPGKAGTVPSGSAGSSGSDTPQVPQLPEEYGDTRAATAFNSDWRFYKTAPAGEPKDPTFNDSAWTAVTLPHTWNAEDVQENGANTGNYYRGVGWYRKTFTFDAATYAGRQIYLEFGAASTKADVYVDGVLAGTHMGPYAAFRFDITHKVTLDQPVVIAVKVDNSVDDRIAGPWATDADFSVQGGLYRGVRLVTTDKLHVDMATFGSSGLFLTPTDVTAAGANLNVKAKLYNETAAAANVTVKAQLVSREGVLVKTMTQALTIPAKGSLEFNKTERVSSPHLWDGVDDPYLYTVTLAILDDSGKALDALSARTGFRSYRIDKEEGFFLNGRYVNLHGVNYHQDTDLYGWGAGEDVRRADYDVIQAMGANAMRMAHYQHAAWEYDVTDEMGFAVWTEIPQVKNWPYTGSGATKKINPEFVTNLKQQLQEMIFQNYNHPSAMFWGMSNESSDTELNPASGVAFCLELMKELSDLAHAIDPNRLTTLATDQGSTSPYFQAATDLKAMNRYSGWYVPDVYEFNGFLNARKAKSSSPVGISEYGAGGNPDQHMDNPTFADLNSSSGQWHPEEYQAAMHEAQWSQIGNRKDLWAKYIWLSFDFASAKKMEGGKKGTNDKGMVTRDRETKKDVYYFYQSVWTAEPMVYITSRRFGNRPHMVPMVKIYSNCDSVELFVDGVSKGEITCASLAGTQNDNVFIWSDIDLGTTQAATVRAVAKKAGTTVEDTVVWTGIPGTDTRLTSQELQVLEASVPLDATGKPVGPRPDSKIGFTPQAKTLAEYLANFKVPYGATVQLFDGAAQVTDGRAPAVGMTLKVTAEDGVQTRIYQVIDCNLALLKPISASSMKGNSPGSNAVNGDTASSNDNATWAVPRDGKDYYLPGHLIIDLGDTYDIASVQTYLRYDGSREYDYQIYVANELNGEEWLEENAALDLKDGGQLLADHTGVNGKVKHTGAASVTKDTPAGPITARYVKFVLKAFNGQTTTQTHPGIRQIEVYGHRVKGNAGFEVDGGSKTILAPANATVEQTLAGLRVYGNYQGLTLTDANDEALTTGTLPAGSKFTVTDANGAPITYTMYPAGAAVPVGMVQLNKTSVTINANSAYLLSATVLPTFAANKTLSWASSDEDVVTVSETGLVRASAVTEEKTAVITAKATDGSDKQDTCTVTVKPVLQGEGTLELRFGTPTALFDSVTAGMGRDIFVDVSISETDKLRTHDWKTFDAARAGIRNTVVTIDLPQELTVTSSDEVDITGYGFLKLDDAVGFAQMKEDGSDIPGVSAKAPSAVISNNGHTLTLSGLDLMPNNGVDVRLKLKAKTLPAGRYEIASSYQPRGEEMRLQTPAVLSVTQTVSDFERVLDKGLTYRETTDTYTAVSFHWTPAAGATGTKLLQRLSTDFGKTWGDWTEVLADAGNTGTAKLTDLAPGKLYEFKLAVASGVNVGESNTAKFYSGKISIKDFGAVGEVQQGDFGVWGGAMVTDEASYTNGTKTVQAVDANDTEAIQAAVDFAASIGGGTVVFPGGTERYAGTGTGDGVAPLYIGGTYLTGTIHLKSNVYLYVDTNATILARHNSMDAPEPYFLGAAYQPGDCYNGTRKAQDTGHSFFSNALFTGKRLDNFKIIGTGVIDGNGAITAQDAGKGYGNIVDHTPNDKNVPTLDPLEYWKSWPMGDKLISVHLSTNFELGGEEIENPSKQFPEPLWNLENNKSLDGPAENPTRAGFKYDEGDLAPGAGNTHPLGNGGYGTYSEFTPYALYDPRLNSDPEGIPAALKLRRGGHFVLLAGAVDSMNLHDIYYLNGTAKNARGEDSALAYGSRQRDMLDMMNCQDVEIKRIFAANDTDDIIKIASDFSLGFRRPTKNYDIDWVVARTQCSLFKIGSETAADTLNINATNLYGYNISKCGISVNENDGATIDGVFIDGAEFYNTLNPISINTTSRNRNGNGATTGLVSRIKNVEIKNVKAYGQDFDGIQGTRYNELGPLHIFGHGSSATVENVLLENIDVVLRGGKGHNTDKGSKKFAWTGEASDKNIDPVYTISGYDARDYFMNSGSPAYGFIMNQAKDVTLKNLKLSYYTDENSKIGAEYRDEFRYAFYVKDSANVTIDGAEVRKGTDDNATVITAYNTDGLQFKDVSYFTRTVDPQTGATGEKSALTVLADFGPEAITEGKSNRVEWPTPPPPLPFKGDQTLAAITTRADSPEPRTRGLSVHLPWLTGNAADNKGGSSPAINDSTKTITAIIGTTVGDLKAELCAADGGTDQAYEVKGSGDAIKEDTALLLKGDTLHVTSGDGAHQETYTIASIQTTINGRAGMMIGGKSGNLDSNDHAQLVSSGGLGSIKNGNEGNIWAGFGTMRELNPAAVGNYLDYVLTNLPAGTYKLFVTHKGKKDRGTAKLVLDGVDTGLTIDETFGKDTPPGPTPYSDILEFALGGKIDNSTTYWSPLYVGEITLEGGSDAKHTFKFEVTDAGVGNAFNIGYFRLIPVTGD